MGWQGHAPRQVPRLKLAERQQAALHAHLGATLRLVGVPPVGIFPLAAPQREESALCGRLFNRALLQA